MLVMLIVTMSAFAQQIGVSTARFASVDVYIDSPEPMAAWQFELADTAGTMTVVGVENGESAAFDDAPYYDIDAVEHGAADRIVVADYSLNPASALPNGRTRVATLHLRLAGGEQPDYDLRLIAAGNAEGRPIHASISLDTRRENP